MNDVRLEVDRRMQAQIDRLVAGELPESERRSVLAWLDEDVRRWRACAVAFLETQSWEAAAADLSPRETFSTAAIASGARVMRAGRAVASQRSAQRYALAMVASIAIAFVAGVFAARLSVSRGEGTLPQIVERPFSESGTPTKPPQPLMATVPVGTMLDPDVRAELQLPITPVASGKAPDSSLSEYERKQWERQGIELTEERRYLPARLPDGRDVIVPVNKVQLKLKPASVS